MKFLLYKSEIELLTELEASFLVPEYFNPDTRYLYMLSEELYDVVSDLFIWIPLLNDKNEQYILAHLGFRIIQALA